MLRYQTSLQNTPPQVAQAPLATSPYAGLNHQDVFRSMGQAQAVDLDRYAQQTEDAYRSRQQAAERELALSGLTMMGQGQQNQANLANQRMQMLLSNLL
jgi:hypothetical protein